MELYKHSNTKKMEQEAKGCIITGPRGQEWEKNPRIYRRHKIIQQTEQIKRISLKKHKSMPNNLANPNKNDSMKIEYKQIRSLYTIMEIHKKSGIPTMCHEIEEEMIMSTNDNFTHKILTRLQNNKKSSTPEEDLIIIDDFLF